MPLELEVFAQRACCVAVGFGWDWGHAIAVCGELRFAPAMSGSRIACARAGPRNRAMLSAPRCRSRARFGGVSDNFVTPWRWCSSFEHSFQASIWERIHRLGHNSLKVHAFGCYLDRRGCSCVVLTLRRVSKARPMSSDDMSVPAGLLRLRYFGNADVFGGSVEYYCQFSFL
jgi:hypothetical protein